MKQIFIIALIFISVFAINSIEVNANSVLEEKSSTTYYVTYDKGRTSTEVNGKNAKKNIELKEKVDKILKKADKELEKANKNNGKIDDSVFIDEMFDIALEISTYSTLSTGLHLDELDDGGGGSDMPRPINVVVTDNILTWDTVTQATGYIVTIGSINYSTSNNIFDLTSIGLIPNTIYSIIVYSTD